MGWADMLILLGIPYSSEEAIQLAEKVMRFINDQGHAASRELAKKRGAFPNFKGSLYDQRGETADPQRNHHHHCTDRYDFDHCQCFFWW